MIHNMQNVDLLSSKINVSNQPASIVADVENNARPNLIRVRPTLLYLGEVSPLCSPDDPVPSGQ
jgi:hypothetical protein